MRFRFRGALFIAAASLAVAFVPVTSALAQENVLQISTAKTHLITVEKGKPKTIRTKNSFFEIVVGDPEIANVQPLTNRSFYVLGVAARHNRHRAVRRTEEPDRLGRRRGERRHDTPEDGNPRERAGCRHQGDDNKRAGHAFGRSARPGVGRPRDENRREIRRRRRRDHQFGQHHLVATGSAQRPFRRNQPQCRAGARRDDRQAGL